MEFMLLVAIKGIREAVQTAPDGLWGCWTTLGPCRNAVHTICQENLHVQGA